MQMSYPAVTTVPFTDLLGYVPCVCLQEMYLNVRREVCLTKGCHPWEGVGAPSSNQADGRFFNHVPALPLHFFQTAECHLDKDLFFSETSAVSESGRLQRLLDKITVKCA